jgi:hypothetical protein
MGSSSGRVLLAGCVFLGMASLVGHLVSDAICTPPASAAPTCAAARPGRAAADHSGAMSHTVLPASGTLALMAPLALIWIAIGAQPAPSIVALPLLPRPPRGLRARLP